MSVKVYNQRVMSDALVFKQAGQRRQEHKTNFTAALQLLQVIGQIPCSFFVPFAPGADTGVNLRLRNKVYNVGNEAYPTVLPLPGVHGDID
jgi:hypothetical protein